MKEKFDKKIFNILEKHIKNKLFSGCSVGFIYNRDSEFKEHLFFCGKSGVTQGALDVKKTTFFDIASLTKPLVTVLALLVLKNEKKIDIHDKLVEILPVNLPREKRNITIKQLVTHFSGFPAHRDYSKILRESPKGEKKAILLDLLLQEELEHAPGEKYIYSDLDYMLLGLLIEIKSGQRLGDYWQHKITNPLGITNCFKIFGDIEESEAVSFAATGKCRWSGELLRGQVHDDNCRAYGNMMGHAGLFATLEGVLSLCKILLFNALETDEHPSIKKNDLLYLLEAKEKERWAYGFDIPTGHNPSSGKYFSERTIGHLGYTGTSFWIDLRQKVIVVVLTNRVIIDDNPSEIRKFRPILHNELLQSIK